MDVKPTFSLGNTGMIVMALAAASSQPDNGHWIHIMPSGEVSPRDGREPWFLADAEAVVAASLAYAGSRPIPVDYDHQMDNAPKNGQPAPAAGWIKQLQARPDGIWGLVEWTEKAQAFMDAKEYRYVSPVFNFTKQRDVTRILRVALTNNPALDLTALANAQLADPQMADLLTQLCGLLVLPDNSSTADIIDAVRQLVEAQCAAKASAVTEENSFNDRLNLAILSIQQQADEAALATTVDRAIEQGHILPHHKEFALELCHSGKGQFEQFVDTVSPFLKGIRGFQSRGIAPEQRDHDPRQTHLDETAKAVCKALGHTHQEFIELGTANAN